MEPIFLSQSANHWQATNNLLKNWFHISKKGQEYSIFIIIKWLQAPEPDDNILYNLFTQPESLKSMKNSKTKLIIKEEECTKLFIKKEKESMESSIKEKEHIKLNTKKKKEKQRDIKIKRAESPVQSTSGVCVSDSQLVSWKQSHSDLSFSLPERTQSSYVYYMR